MMIADDHRVVAESLGVLLARWLDVVAIVDNLADVIPTVERLRPDVAVLDLSFGPAGTCIPLIKPLIDAAPDCRVVILTAHDSAALADNARAAGASRFVAKSASPEEVRRNIEEALGVSGGTRRRPGAEPDEDIPDVGINPFGLSQREAAVLLRMYRGMKQVDIAADIGVATKTVEYYRKRASGKVGIARTPLLLRWVGEREQALEKIAADAG